MTKNNERSHIFTVDVENWYDGIQSLSFHDGPADSRLKANLDRMLDLLAERDVKATFFWLGKVASEHPDLVRKAQSMGHEIGCHGWDHTPVGLMGNKQLRSETGKAIETLSGITGESVVCYRAPFFSIDRKNMWALDVLCELGILYDSSILPARSWRCGYKEFPPCITEVATKSGIVTEVPVSTMNVFGIRIPVGGGAWFRMLPLWLTLWGFASLASQGDTGVFYIHPWELDTGQPLRFFETRAWLCHYWNLQSAQKRMNMILDSHSFTSIGAYFSKGEQDDGAAC